MRMETCLNCFCRSRKYLKKVLPLFWNERLSNVGLFQHLSDLKKKKTRILKMRT